MTKKRIGPPIKHGESREKSPEYRAWSHVKNRCLNTNDPNYQRYGGRGISVCERWLQSFPNFLADMGRKPTPAHSIDRIDNDGNYEPGNCRWATKAQQSANTSRNRPITMGAETRLITEWETVTGIDHQTIAARLGRGWPVEAALSTPVGEAAQPFAGKDRKTHCANGHEYTPENSGRNAAGWRFCRACGRQRSLEYMRAKRARKAV